MQSHLKCGLIQELPPLARSIRAFQLSALLAACVLHCCKILISNLQRKGNDSQTLLRYRLTALLVVEIWKWKQQTLHSWRQNFIAPEKYCHWNIICDIFRMQEKTLLLVATIKYFLFKYQLFILDSDKLENITFSMLTQNYRINQNLWGKKNLKLSFRDIERESL